VIFFDTRIKASGPISLSGRLNRNAALHKGFQTLAAESVPCGYGAARRTAGGIDQVSRSAVTSRQQDALGPNFL
jgi:hypothetical protein